MDAIFGALILLWFCAWCLGLTKPEKVRKYGSRYTCGYIADGLFKGYSLVTYQQIKNVYFAQGKEDKGEFPFENIKKYKIIDVNTYDSVKGAAIGNFIGGNLGAAIGASGQDKIYVKITWASDKTSLVIFDKLGKDRLIRNSYENKNI